MSTRKNSAIRIWLGGGFVLTAAVIGLLLLVFRQKTALAKDSRAREEEIKAGPVVKAVKAGMAPADKGLVLIGEVRPFQSVTLYAKTSGYMNKINVDKGDKVKSGQLLATIVSPETDQAYRAAVADLENKKKVARRDEALVQKDYISKEDAEASATAVAMAEAQVQSLKEQMEYKNIRAPFAGTITARFADPGALVQNATGSQTSAQPIVTLSELDKVRIYVYVSQEDASYLHDGYPVVITMAERPLVKIKATVTRIAGELDPKTRMMLTEIDLENTEDPIIPGSYVQVNLHQPEQKNISIPSEALVIRGSKFFVPLIVNNAIHYQPVEVDKNDGILVFIKSGIAIGDMVGLNINPEIGEGQSVRVKM